jgi:hypothetical protein
MPHRRVHPAPRQRHQQEVRNDRDQQLTNRKAIVEARGVAKERVVMVVVALAQPAAVAELSQLQLQLQVVLE